MLINWRTPVSTVFARTASSSHRCSSRAMSGEFCVAQSLSRWNVEMGRAHGSKRFLCVSATALSTCEHQ